MDQSKGICALFSLTVVMAAVVWPASAETVLTPLHSFELRDVWPDASAYGPLSTKGLVVRNGSLYFAAQESGRRGARFVIHTVTTGRLVGAIPIDTQRVLGVDVDAGGNVYVVHRSVGHLPQLTVFDVAGKTIRSREFSVSPAHFRLWKDGIAAVSQFGEFTHDLLQTTLVTEQLGEGSAPEPEPISPVMAVGLERLIVVNRLDGIVYLQTAHGSRRELRPHSARIDAERTRAETSYEQLIAKYGKARAGKFLLFRDVAIASGTDIFLALSRFDPAEGAVVVRVNDTGEVLETLLLRMPELVEDKRGFMHLSEFAVDGKQLFVLDSRGKIAAYAL